MKIIIPGGSGQVGTLLARAFCREGHEVVVLSRQAVTASDRNASAAAVTLWRVIPWDARTLDGGWTAELEGADAVINLAGRSVNCRYNPHNRRVIKESRVDSVRVVGEAIARAAQPPRVWLQMSTATIYAHRFDAPNDESTGILGGAEPNAPDTWRFSIDVATSWERAFAEAAATPATRKVALRAAMVMSPDRGGVFDTLLGLVRHGLGGRTARGDQYVSWVHEEDFVRAALWLIEREDLHGAVNVASPHPLPNKEFMRDVRQAWGIGFGLPAMRWMLEVGAFFLRTETELILKSRRVTPGRLLDAGFEFRHPQWPEAARELCQRWRDENQHG